MKEEIMGLYVNTVKSIKENYNKDQEKAELIVDGILRDTLSDIIIDSKNILFQDFYKKHNLDMMLFEYTDFTSSEIKTIISETPLTERDRKIAYYRFVNLKSEDDIANELYIDKKTVHNNLPKISVALKNTCNKLYSKK